MAKFTSNLVINTRWRNNDFVGAAGSTHTFADPLYDEFLVDWADEISKGHIVITETPTTGNIQMSSLTVGDITLTGTATGFPGAPAIIGTSPISVVTASGTSTVSLNASYSTSTHNHNGTYQPVGTYITAVSGTSPISVSTNTANASTVSIDTTLITAAAATSTLVTRTLVRNSTTATIARGTVVYLASSNGTIPTVEKALATTDATSARTFGIVVDDIATNSNGYVLNQGVIDPVNTSGIADGALLWLSTTVAGGYSTVKPVGPNHGVLVGVCVKGGSVGNGSIYVFIKNGAELDEIHDVNISGQTNGQALVWSSSQSVWINQSIDTAVASVSGTSPISATGTTAISLSHATTDGNRHVPATSTTNNGKFLKAGATAASEAWANIATSDITSGNYVATLAAGTGVTVTGADANAAAKTVAIGQAVATSSSPTFAAATITGNIDAATFDKVTITAPATSATLTIANMKTFTASNTLTLTGTDSSSVDVGNGGSLVPAGTVQIYLGHASVMPTGWLLCAGGTASRTTYATLFGVLGTRFGAGDGSTTFGLPDLQGHMLVGSAAMISTATGTASQTGTGDAYANATWDHNHSHSHVTNPAATTSGTPSLTVTSLTQTGAGTAGASNHTHSTDIAATTSDTDSTAMSVSPTQKRTRVNYIIKW